MIIEISNNTICGSSVDEKVSGITKTPASDPTMFSGYSLIHSIKGFNGTEGKRFVIRTLVRIIF